MTVNISKIAKAAAISIKQEEKERLQSQVEPIIEILCQLKEVNTDNIEPLITPFQGNLVLREDNVIDPQSEITVMKSANNARYGYFITPKFVES